MQTDSSRSRQELSNEYLIAAIGVDSAENGPFEICDRKTEITEYSILTSEYSNFDKKVYSKLFFFVGDSPSNIQFYLTDSLSNFLSASVYFNSRPNYDSLYPYIHYIRSDIKKIIESFDWINE